MSGRAGMLQDLMVKKQASKTAKPETDVFREQECKLNASSADDLEKIRHYILTNPHYTHANDPKLLPSWLAGMAFTPAHEKSAVRYRTYFDTVEFNAFDQGVEIRVESNGDGTSGPYKQMVKIAMPGTVPGIMDRMEYQGKISGPVPDLSLIKDGNAEVLKDIFKVKSLGKLSLYPLLQIATQRWKSTYHPNGDRNTRIEVALDAGRGMTCAGQSWDLFQLELELLRGDPACLELERARLLYVFNYLTAESRSKPSTGMDFLRPLMARADVKALMKQELRGQPFRILDSMILKI